MKCMQYLKLIHSFSGWNVHLAIDLQLVLQKIKMDIKHVLEKQNNFAVFMLNFRGARKGARIVYARSQGHYPRNLIAPAVSNPQPE